MLCCAKSLEKMTFGQVISIGIVCLVCYGRICVFMGELWESLWESLRIYPYVLYE